MTNPRVVIVGAGFGGLTAAKALADKAFDVTVIDQHNYHLFQPLLYQVATAGLSPADIASPIRGILARAQNVNVILGKVSGIDTERREVLADGRRVPYDTLVLATGAQHAYFGHGDWAAFAPGLKTIDDATYIRRRILLAFEKAETETDAAERARLLNFVIIGGGPTGVETAGAIAELANRALAKDFRSIDPRAARIILVEAAPRLLTPFDPPLSEAARTSLEQLGVEVRTGSAVTALDDAGVSIGAERIEARTVIWAAGVMASPAGQWLGAETDRAGRVKIEPDLSVPGRPDVFVIGDTAALNDANGNPAARRRAGRQAAGHLCGEASAGPAEGRDRRAVPLSRFRLACHHRAQARHHPDGPLQAEGFPRLADVVRGAHLLPDRLPQSFRGRDLVAVELPYLPARDAANHRHVRARVLRNCRCRRKRNRSCAAHRDARHARHSSARQRRPISAVKTIPMIA